MKLVKLSIGGRSVAAASGKAFPVHNPANGEEIARVAEGDVADVSRAVEAAGRGFAVWGAMPPHKRADVLNRAAALLAAGLPAIVQVEVEQTGRPIREMEAQLARLPEWYSYFAAVARTFEDRVFPFGGPYLNYARRAPLGVVGLITPWNHPLLILTKKLAPALAAGNAVVAKPSELAPLTPFMLADIFAEAGLPDGAYNVVSGFGATAGAALASHPGIRKLDITGGTNTGRRAGAIAGERLIPFSAELGGKASVVIFADAPLDAAVSGALFASFIAAGQTCVQGARLLVERRIYDDFVSALVARAEKIRIGDPTDMNTELGPLISANQLATVERYVAIGRDEGARLAGGGHRLNKPPFDRGHYYQPTIFADVTNEMQIAQDEIFGPVACIIPFDDEQEAICLANGTKFGLAAGIWTGDVARAHRVAPQITAGIVWINDHHRIDPSSPWGGFGDSGLGKENGVGAYESYTRQQSIVLNYSGEPFDWYGADKRPQRYS